MNEDLVWENMHVGEAYAVGADWAPALGTGTLNSVEAVVIAGQVDLNTNPPLGFQEIAGSVQNVWRSGGVPGIVRVLVTANIDDGRVLKEIYTFRVLPVT